MVRGLLAAYARPSKPYTNTTAYVPSDWHRAARQLSLHSQDRLMALARMGVQRTPFRQHWTTIVAVVLRVCAHQSCVEVHRQGVGAARHSPHTKNNDKHARPVASFLIEVTAKRSLPAPSTRESGQQSRARDGQRDWLSVAQHSRLLNDPSKLGAICNNRRRFCWGLRHAASFLALSIP